MQALFQFVLFNCQSILTNGHQSVTNGNIISNKMSKCEYKKYTFLSRLVILSLIAVSLTLIPHSCGFIHIKPDRSSRMMRIPLENIDWALHHYIGSTLSGAIPAYFFIIPQVFNVFLCYLQFILCNTFTFCWWNFYSPIVSPTQ